MAEYEGLAFRAFTSKAETDKAINTLRGILSGIRFDKEVTDSEIAELKGWCHLHESLIDRNPFKEFMKVIKESDHDVKNRMDLIEDLFWLCQKYEVDSYYYEATTADLQTLQGLCHGILADGEVKDEEIRELDKWLEDHEYLATYYPYDEIKSLVISILSDGKINELERRRLMAYFNEFVNLNDKELSQKIKTEISDININGICTSDPEISFDGAHFCFTGVSERANRSEIEQQIMEFGGKFQNCLTQATNYLIVGNGGNPCWAFACYGRKVEAAVKLRKKGSQISIIHEFDFWDCLEDRKLMS